MDEHEFPITNAPAGLESVQRRLQAVLQDAGIRQKVISALNLALGEWIENIIQHAYADGASHPITVLCRIGPAEIVVRVIDDGRPFNPCAFPALDPAAAAQGLHTGRGIHLIRHLMDRVEYERRGDKNVLTLARSVTWTGQ